MMMQLLIAAVQKIFAQLTDSHLIVYTTNYTTQHL